MNINPFLEASVNDNDSLGNDPWLSYLHDNKNTGYSDCEMSSSLKYKWSLHYSEGDFPGELSGKVAILNGTVFTASMPEPSSNTRKTLIQAFDIKSGMEKWDTNVSGRLCFTGVSMDQNNDTIYFATTDGWSNRWNSNRNSTVYCISANDGEEIWETPIDGAIFGSLVLSEEYIFCQTFYADSIDESQWESEKGEIICIDKESGDEIWEAELNSSWYNINMCDTPPCKVSDYIIVPNDSIKGDNDKNIIASGNDAIIYLISNESGEIEWKIDNSYKNYSLPSVSSDDKNIYVSWTYINPEDGKADLYVESYSIDKKRNWSFKQTNCINWSCSPMQDNNNIYIKCRDGYIYSIDKSKGKLNWRKNCFDDGDGSAMCITDGYIICAGYEWEEIPVTKNKTFIKILNTEDGKILWEDTINNDIIVQIAAYSNFVIFSGKESIYCYEIEKPILEVSDDEIDFGDAKKGDKLEKRIKVWNSGSGDLSGEITTRERWINIEPDKITKNSQYITISIDTDELNYGESNGEIEIITNGGDKNIPVSVNIIDDTPPELIIDYPENNFKTKDNSISISGRAIDEESGIKKITINGKEVEFDDDGYFESNSLSLNIGNNKFTIVATNNVDLSTKVEINVIREEIDTTPPDIQILKPKLDLNNKFITKDEFITLSGRAIDEESGIKKITINGKEVEFDDDGYFESNSLSLNIGNNKFTIVATNNVDLSTKVEILILRDIDPPILTILSLGENEIVYTPIITISGYAIDQDSGVSEVLINNVRVDLSIDGKFEKKVNLTEGMNPFYIKATDNVGNETSKLITITYKVRKIIIITLTIGDRVAFINDEPHILDSPPIIRNGRTLVPIRFIAEAFGAKVDFIPHPTNEVQIRYKDKFIHLWINSIKAKIEYPPELEIPSKVVTLETPPIIINGRTLVPLRFIGEELGAKVDWNSKTQTITLTLEETI
jgi:outer membrane protein assembly factor BamB